jgi:hypothetical protein
MGVFVALFFFFGLSQAVQAADVECQCPAEERCSDININFLPSNPGVYMTIEYGYGKKNVEGMATVTRDSELKQVVYKLGNFTLVDKEGEYSLPMRPHTCN